MHKAVGIAARLLLLVALVTTVYCKFSQCMDILNELSGRAEKILTTAQSFNRALEADWTSNAFVQDFAPIIVRFHLAMFAMAVVGFHFSFMLEWRIKSLVGGYTVFLACLLIVYLPLFWVDVESTVPFVPMPVSSLCLHTALLVWMLCEVTAQFNYICVPLLCFSLRVIDVMLFLSGLSVLLLVLLNAHWTSILVISSCVTLTTKMFALLGSASTQLPYVQDSRLEHLIRASAKQGSVVHVGVGETNGIEAGRSVQCPPPYDPAWFAHVQTRTRPSVRTAVALVNKKGRTPFRNGNKSSLVSHRYSSSARAPPAPPVPMQRPPHIYGEFV